MPTPDEFIAAAWRAAPTFGLEPSDISLLSHSENVVCRVSLDAATACVMRLHRPGYNSIDELESEVEWVAALARSGLPVPSAMPTRDGVHYTTVAIGDESRHVGVVGWVDGEPLGGPIETDGETVVDHYRRIGELAAAIRIAGTGWTPPVGFVRRVWDADGLAGDSPIWGRFWEVDALNPDQRRTLERCRELIRRELAALPVAASHFGLIHADLHLGNLMSNGADLTVIDFDDAGFGWWMHELAVALHPVRGESFEPDARRELVAGYRSLHPLDDRDEALIDTFMTMRSLMILGWLAARCELPAYRHLGALTLQAVNDAERYLDQAG